MKAKETAIERRIRMLRSTLDYPLHCILTPNPLGYVIHTDERVQIALLELELVIAKLNTAVKAADSP